MKKHIKSKNEIDLKYESYYRKRNPAKVYPTEFVVRIFLSSYPNLSFKAPAAGQSILDVGFGDGRNTLFLCELGLDVYGLEITKEIVDLTNSRINKSGYSPDLRVGRNSSIPFPDASFDYILACHSCYYCDEGDTLTDNLKEYYRALKSGGFLIASVPDSRSYIFENALKLDDGTYRISRDPYGNRVGYRLHAFTSTTEVANIFSPFFNNFSFGHAQNDYFGIDERVFWVVCQK